MINARQPEVPIRVSCLKYIYRVFFSLSGFLRGIKTNGSEPPTRHFKPEPDLVSRAEHGLRSAEAFSGFPSFGPVFSPTCFLHIFGGKRLKSKARS